MNDLFSPAASFGVVGLSIFVTMVGYKAFATPALIADPSRRDWLHAFAAAVLSTFAVLLVLVSAAMEESSLLAALGAGLVTQAVVVGAVYRSVVAGLVLVVGAQLLSAVFAIGLLLHPLALAVALTAWGAWILERDRSGDAQRRSFLER